MFGIYSILVFFEAFHNHYLKKDVLLLVDTFEKLISTNLKHYNLDPCHYFSAPGLLMGCYVKNHWSNFRKNNDPDKYMVFEQGKRGGVSYINKSYSEASKNNHILYLDMNNLYGHVMSQYLPYADFKLVKNI